MCIAVYFFQPVDAHLGVDLCAGKTFVTQNFLNNSQVCTGIQHMRCKTVAQAVRRYAPSSGQTFSDLILDDALNTSGRERTTAMIDKEGAVLRSTQLVTPLQVRA